MKTRRFNWPIWTGFLLSIVAFLSYFFVFVWFPSTRDFPWANLLLFGLSAALIVVGLRRAFAPDRNLETDNSPSEGVRRPRRSKIVGVILATISVAICGVFIFATFIFARRLPASAEHPRVGQTAPDFTLADTNNKPVSLAELRTTPVKGNAPKGVLLVFYRGYW
jgi:hypothetical protein